jgi:hypothetical protein
LTNKEPFIISMEQTTKQYWPRTISGMAQDNQYWSKQLVIWLETISVISSEQLVKWSETYISYSYNCSNELLNDLGPTDRRSEARERYRAGA